MNGFYDMLVGLQSESPGYIPKPLTDTIQRVSFGAGFLFYDRFDRGHKIAFLQRLKTRPPVQGIDHLVLTYEQGKTLQQVASAVNIAYDPGEPEDTPENIEKRTFNFAAVMSKIPEGTRLYEV